MGVRKDVPPKDAHASTVPSPSVLHHLTYGCSEVHIVFDNPGRQPNSPKSFECKCRDDTASLSSDHKHVAFSDACSVPSNWRDCLACRECKGVVFGSVLQAVCSGYT